MGKKDNGGGFIVQASILAITGILCRIIGLLYRSPLANIIGDEGNGYYTAAYNIYTIILLVSSYSIPSAISKVIAERLALKQYKNAHRIFKCAIIYVVIIGGIASIFTYTCAKWLVVNESVMALRIFAPTIFLSGLLGVLRGYFQAHGTMLQTSCSQIIEQILNAVVSLAAAYLFMQAVSGQGKTVEASYGAAGSALGTAAGVVIALIFMLLMYLLNRKIINNHIAHDKRKEVDSYGHIFKIIIFMVTPVIMSTFVYNSSTTVNQTIYQKILELVYHVPTTEIAANYGIFAGKSVVIVNIPIAIASAMAAAMIPMISGSYATGDQEATNDKIQRGIKTTMLISIPCAVGLFALAEPVMLLLFGNPPESVPLAASLLRVMSISVVFYALSTLTNGVLQGIGKVNKPITNAAIALIIQTVVLVPLLLVTDLNLYGLAIVTIIYSFSMCILNQRALRQCLGYRLEMIGTFLKPTLASLVMGLVAWGCYRLVYMVIPKNIAGLLVSISLAAIVYFVLVIKIGAINEEEMRSMPKGTLLVKLAKKLGLL